MKPILELAIRARQPLVSVQTDDAFNVLKDLDPLCAGRHLTEQQATGVPVTDRVYWTEDPKLASDKQLDKFIEAKTTLVLINVRSDLALDCGTIPVNVDRLVQTLAEVDPLAGPAVVAAMLPLLRGLTVRQALTCASLAVAQNLKLTPEGIRDVRLHLYGKQVGLEFVPTSDMGPYEVPPELKDWLEVNGPYLGHPELSPRGVLLSGPAGTGKTMGAKYLARRLGLPLQRLDLSAVLSKYIGESEVRLRELLASVDRESPCVLLIDESEKLFKPANDTGVTDRLLSQLLWWMQEHESTVLTVLTTNDHGKMPPELFRPGRVDATFKLKAVEGEEALKFCRTYAKEVFGVALKTLPKSAVDMLPPDQMSYAGLATYVAELVKRGKLVPATIALKQSI